jgi:hypothetical protein
MSKYLTQGNPSCFLQSVHLCQVLSGAHMAYHCHHVCHFQIVFIKFFAIEELFVLRKNLPNVQRICTFRGGSLAACLYTFDQRRKTR